MINNDKEFNRYSISVRDFEKAIEFLKETESTSPDSLAFESLLIAGLICYCRPFSANERNKKAGADKRIEFQSFSNMSDEEISLHKNCMILRNKAIAHSEWMKYPTRIDLQRNIIRSRHYSLLSEKIDWHLLLELSKKLKNQCDNYRADYLNEQKRNSI